MTSHEETRKTRIAHIQTAVRKLQNCSKNDLIAECQMMWGASRRTILEYIKLLVTLGKMRDVKGVLKWGK